MEMLDETVFVGHPLSRESQDDRERDQETFRDVGDDDSDEENDGVNPGIAHEEGNRKKDNPVNDDHNTDN